MTPPKVVGLAVRYPWPLCCSYAAHTALFATVRCAARPWVGRGTTHSDTCPCSRASIIAISGWESESALLPCCIQSDPMTRPDSSGRQSGGRARFRWRPFLCNARPRGRTDAPRRSRVAGARPTRPTARLLGPGHHQEAYTPPPAPSHNAAKRRLAGVLWIARPAWRRGAPHAGPTGSCAPERGRRGAGNAVIVQF